MRDTRRREWAGLSYDGISVMVHLMLSPTLSLCIDDPIFLASARAIVRRGFAYSPGGSRTRFKATKRGIDFYRKLIREAKATERSFNRHLSERKVQNL